MTTTVETRTSAQTRDASRDPAAPFDRHPADRVIRWRTALALVGAAAALYVAARVLPAAPSPAADVLPGVGGLLSRTISRVTGAIPLATGEVALGAYAVWTAAAVVLAMRAALAGRRRWRNAFAGGVTRALRDGAIVVLAFYLLWGHNYARGSLETSVGWPEWRAVETDELVALAEDALAAANDAYIALHGSPDIGHPTRVDAGLRATGASLDEGYRRAAAMLGLPARAGTSYGATKFPLASRLLVRFGIIGVYFPWTGEANVLRDLPAMQIAHTIAHEKAHQRGFASEADANFVGFMAAAVAPDPLSRYSAAMFAHMQLSRTLSRAPRETRLRLAEARLPGVQRDIEDLSAFYAQFRGPARRVGTVVNDRYLRANGVREGVANYDRSARLLIAYALDNGGRVMPEWPE